MHYLLTVIGDTDNPADDSAPGAIDAFNDRLKDEGRWVFGGGLDRPAGRHRRRQPRRRAGASPTGRSWSPRSSSPASGSIRRADLDVALALSADAAPRACRRKVEVRRSGGVA